MTAGQPSTQLLPASQVSELIQSMAKALRAFQMYLPNNPIYQRAIQNVRTAFKPIWATTEELELKVVETELIWDDQVVYRQINKGESIAWTLFKDGMRMLTIYKGAEDEESDPGPQRARSGPRALTRHQRFADRSRKLSPG